MNELYAIVDGENVPVATLSDQDRQKIGRGYKIGYSFGVVTDTKTGKRYKVKQASCGIGTCACAVTVEEV